MARGVFQRVLLLQRDHGALGASGHRAADVRQRRGAASGGQDELGQAGQRGIVVSQRGCSLQAGSTPPAGLPLKKRVSLFAAPTLVTQNQ